MKDSTRIRRISTAFGAALLVICCVAAMFHAFMPDRAHADELPATSAYGVRILDIDGGVQQEKAPLSEWSSGNTVSNDLDATGDFFKLNTTRSQQLESRAASDGAFASIASGDYQLRDRPAVTFSDLQVSCTRDGKSEVSFGSLKVNDTDILQQDKLASGYTYDLPTSKYGETRVYVAQRESDKDSRTTTTALRIEAEAGASEIWRVQLGVVSCAPAETEKTVPAVSGVTVVSPSGKTLIDGQPSVDSVGSATSPSITSTEVPVTAKNVTVRHDADGGSHVDVESFEQIPDTSDIGMYMWSALRVYGLSLDVKADGSSSIALSGGSSGIFVNGVWINSGTDLYTGMAPDGTPRVHVYLNERVVNQDGSITINALRYEDLTGTYPSVILGQVHWSAQDSHEDPDPTPTPDPSPSDGTADDDAVPTGRYAYGLYAQGPSPVSPVALSASGDGAKAKSLSGTASKDEATDGYAGQISATKLSSTVDAKEAKASVSSLLLYPGTAIEVRLTDVSVQVGHDGSVKMTTGGGSVAGKTIAAGSVAANTRITVPGRSTTIVLNAQERQAGALQRVSGVALDDSQGLGAEVRAAVVSSSAPDTTANNPPRGAGPSDAAGGHDLGSGAITSASDGEGGGGAGHLATTGTASLWAVGFVVLCAALSSVFLVVRARRGTRG